MADEDKKQDVKALIEDLVVIDKTKKDINFFIYNKQQDILSRGQESLIPLTKYLNDNRNSKAFASVDEEGNKLKNVCYRLLINLLYVLNKKELAIHSKVIRANAISIENIENWILMRKGQSLKKMQSEALSILIENLKKKENLYLDVLSDLKKFQVQFENVEN